MRSDRSSQNSTQPERKRFSSLSCKTLCFFHSHLTEYASALSPKDCFLFTFEPGQISLIAHFYFAQLRFSLWRFVFPSFICWTPGLREPILLLLQGIRLLLNKSEVWWCFPFERFAVLPKFLSQTLSFSVKIFFPTLNSIGILVFGFLFSVWSTVFSLPLPSSR